ncbi:calcium-binding protein [Nostoc sp. 'Peltigera malacea cyanobiont' DB3992]|uniref:calcium-binding protein n=1 Tax=Nostoc sp. 'Peltigera malacea cyanobiont' DB3992 TaxID=1206980 RepID=UPI000C04B700|nr:calcium-binding protein [Nostoc sp. 'Peltigera malacea cyanobiont' DB3992]PHM07806.1 hemolysin [Nostoc sp. 'Peltigera malacea cyanobiont' DB3992]
MALIIGTDGDDILVGTGGNDTFLGSAGNDTITGGKGNDIIDYSGLEQPIVVQPVLIKKGAVGNDTFKDFFETVIGATGQINIIDATSDSTNVSIIADLSKERLEIRVVGSPPIAVNVKNFVNIIGTNQNDVITGDARDNELSGSGGNDIITGSAGNDTLNGGDGIDTGDYSKLGQSSTIFIDGTLKKGGGLGTDLLGNFENLVGDASAVNNTIDASMAPSISFSFLSDLSVNANLETQSFVVNNLPGGNTAKFTFINFDNIKGTNQSDTIVGDRQNNLLFGNGGDDTLSGKSGNDILTGGNGNDTLTGGVGADKFVFSNVLEGVDIIKDFKAAEGDKIQVSQAGFGAISISDFSYDALTGSLFFQESRFAIVENKPIGFQANLDIQIV